MKRMQKFGYTLAETLIALGIVGVLAALMLPMINKIKPDTTKISYLKVYDVINEAVDIMINNQTVYPLENESETRELYKTMQYLNYPLYNSVEVENGVLGLDISSGSQKFCEVLATSFGVPNNKVACNNTNLTGSLPSFSLKDGSDFIVNAVVTDPQVLDGKWRGRYLSKVLFDVDGLKNGKNTSEIDQFTFHVYADGRVLPADDKGRGYLSKRMDVRKSNLAVTDFTAAAADSKFETFDLEYRETPPFPMTEIDVIHNTKLGTSSSEYGSTNIYRNKRVYAEHSNNTPATQQEAQRACESRGMTLPSYHVLSAMGAYASVLGLESGNYWATPGNDNKARVCSIPEGNCGINDSSNRFEYRCIKME